MKRWWSMVGKEWRGTWTLLAVAIAAVVALDVWLDQDDNVVTQATRQASQWLFRSSH